MKQPSPDAGTALYENILLDPAYDISGKYMAVGHLKETALASPSAITPGTAVALGGLLGDEGLRRQSRAYFVFREAASTLGVLIVHPSEGPLQGLALRTLKRILADSHPGAHRAAAEALGSLPLKVRGPRPDRVSPCDGPPLTLRALQQGLGVSPEPAPRFAGRSLTLPTASGDRLLVIKMARDDDPPDFLSREAFWMDFLNASKGQFPLRFDVPEPIPVNGGFRFRLEDPRLAGRLPDGLHPERWAIAFLAHPDYFVYPNESPALSCEEAGEILRRNAWLLGRLASRGVVHTAPIPLFHNRVQRHRREDRGLYQWSLRGRLDQWLGSCAYPNVGRSGLRDFEHLVPLTGSGRDLYLYIGTHLLSLFLLAGSCFRSREPSRVGLDERGRPVDARDLFDARAFTEMLKGVFREYYDGFVGTPYTGELPFAPSALVARMIEEMGVDRHMEEVLRVHDQERMTDEGFAAFLSRRGVAPAEMARLARGKEDIVLITGPHLGGFNERISLPELINAVESMAALCVCGRYCAQSSNADRPCPRRDSASRAGQRKY
jgi:hypothetical protein